jgi:hypothetical protein
MCAKRKELTPEEKAKSYSKYYYMEITKPDQTLIDKIKKGPIDPKDALRQDKINDLFKPGYLASESGYYKFPDGSAYVSNYIKMPGVTIEMFDWWFAWHPLDPLRYKIWNPEDHFDVQVSDLDRKRLTDSSIPLRERNWGCTHYVKEDVGFSVFMKLLSKLSGKDVGNIVIHFVSPEKIGFEMSHFSDPETATAVCSKDEASTMVHFARKAEGGIELRSRYWLSSALALKVPLIFLEKFTLHNIKEYTHLAKILPSVYTEEKGNGQVYLGLKRIHFTGGNLL